MLSRMCMTLALLVMGSMLLAADEAGPAFPEGLKGFRGTLTGTVGEVGPKGLAFDLRVTRAVAAEGKNARDPQAAVGQLLGVNAQWVNIDGKWSAAADQVEFIHSLKPGQEITIAVVNDEGTRLHLVEVPK